MSAAGSGRDARIAASVVGLRSPLARIELAAGQLARDAATPSARDLAGRVSAAVSEIDSHIGRVLGFLAAGPSRPCADCRSDLETVWARLAPVLRARGLAARLELPETPVPGDAESVRRAAVALVRDALADARAGDSLTVALRDEGPRYGVALEAAPRGSLASEPRFARGAAGALAARLEHEPDAGRTILWIGRGEGS